MLLGRSVVDLAGDVDKALMRLADARGLQAQAQQALALADDDVREAMVAVQDARDALFKEHPELAGGSAAPSPVADPPVADAVPEGLDPSKFEAIGEVDDDNDPRYTSGASSVSSVDSEPLPPVVWGEHDE